MNRLTSVLLLGGALAFLLAGDPSRAAAQTTFNACRVPGVGAIYMVGVAGAPAACLDASHVAFSWTEGGAPADGSVTSAKIADGTIAPVDIAADAVTGAAIAPDAVGSADVLDNSLTAADLAPNSVGASELAAAAVTNVLLGSGTANATTYLRGDRTWAPIEKVTRIDYNGTVGAVAATPHAFVRTIGSFTKDHASTGITLQWHSAVNYGTGGFCEWEVRIDDTNPPGATYWGAVVYAAHQAVSLDGYWSGLSAGSHTVSLYVYGFGNTCTDNTGNFFPYVLVYER